MRMLGNGVLCPTHLILYGDRIELHHNATGAYRVINDFFNSKGLASSYILCHVSVPRLERGHMGKISRVG